jgi:uncharacterized protein YbjT (DUF2867 family)
VKNRILVTGGTGTLGRAVISVLRNENSEARVLSRTNGTGHTGDLLTGVGVQEAFSGVSTVIHCATGGSAKDVAAAGTLIRAAQASGSPHIVYISIVGIDEIPLGYYKAKLEVEHLLHQSGLPVTILRIIDAQRKLPLMLVPRIPLQPIDVSEVAARLVDLSLADAAAGRVSDIGGPDIRPLVEFAHTWKTANRAGNRIQPFVLPGRLSRAYREGHHLAEQNRGTVTFEDFLAARTQP